MRNPMGRIGLLLLAIVCPVRADDAPRVWEFQSQQGVADAEYEISRTGAAWQSPNRAQGFATHFGTEGILLVSGTAEVPAWEWGLTLLGIGRPGAVVAVEPALQRVDGQRIEYDRRAVLEWYVNDARGLEQGFTLEAPPSPVRGAVSVELALEGTLDPVFSADGQAVDFKIDSGTVVLRYSQLAVFDATGERLPARMDGFAAPEVRGIRITFDDTAAIYPVTVDPLATTAAWTAESNQASAGYGSSLAPAGDVNGDGYSDVDFERGFARLRCDACRREFLVALSCKTRGYCPSCNAKRSAVWAEWLTEEVLEPVDHVHWVFTVPKRLRLFFLYDRKLLGDLARGAWRTVRDLYGVGLADHRAVPGMVASIQTWGDLANWQPHIHALATAGVVDRQGRFTPLDTPPGSVAEEMFRRRVLRMLVDRAKLDEDAAEGLLTWKHSGFSVHNKIRANASDGEGLERLGRYLVHPPIAQQRLRYSGADAPCSYRGRRVHPLTGQDHVELDPLEMLARLCQHIPPPGFHTTRLYGAYSNRTRAARARTLAAADGREPDDHDVDAPAPTASQQERRKQWARLIAKVFEVDPLRCPCGATMRIVAVILEPPVIRKILDHLARPEARAHAPPAAG